MTKFDTVIGLEVHVELSTKSKIFCGCSTEFTTESNTNCCPICLGMPGAIYVANKRVVEYAIKAALALNCQVAEMSGFDRKLYFYPDMPKAYQISQYETPLAQDGYIQIEVEGEQKHVGIEIMHMEEDAGKLIHEEEKQYSLVDLNRAGVPLIEIVSKPEMHSAEEAWLYLNKLKTILQYVDVSDCKIEEGSMRCDINISLKPAGSKDFGTKVEVKNLGSFRAVRKAIEYEQHRQRRILEEGGSIVQETRRWDEVKGCTIHMRGKVENRYSPEPSLPPVFVSKDWMEQIRKTMPELPDARKNRYVSDYGLPTYDADVITSSKKLSDFYEECVRYHHDPKIISNWVMVEMLGLINETGVEIVDIRFTPKQLADLLILIDKGTISGKIAKDVFKEMFDTGESPELIVRKKGLIQISDESKLEEIAQRVIDENPKSVKDFNNGKEKALGFLVGQVMRHTKGKANPQMVNDILRRLLS
jgi:aspartyl-tRNA(Asn)/glutamyl-tRNA(Gln) amidotransferase subunit B